MKKALLLGLLALPQAAVAQTESFIVRAGNDTIAVESFTLTDQKLQGELSGRAAGGRTRYVVELTNGVAQRIAVEMFAQGSDSATLRADIAFSGDSAIAQLYRRGVKQPAQRLKSVRNAVPFINLATSFFELALRNIPRGVGDSSMVTFFSVANGALFETPIKWLAADSALLQLGGIDVYLHVDARGRILHARAPAQNVTMERVAGVVIARPTAPPDYSAPAHAPYTAENVTIPTREGHTLAGTLTLPKDRTGDVPVVVTISGSGLQDRDETVLRGYRPFREIAEAMAGRGVAVLRYDDRGFGASTGDPSRATSADFANDTRAVVDWLRTRSEIDDDEIFLLGHSEGGIIAPHVAAEDDDIAGLILLAGPGHTGRAILEYQNRRALELDAARTPAQRDSLLRAALAAIDALGPDQAWLRWFRDYDPLPTLRKVKVPVLILHGATDRQVSADQAEIIARTLRAAGNTDVAVHVLPDVNHLFLSDPVGDASGYSALTTRTVVPQLLQLIGDWIVQQSK